MLTAARVFIKTAKDQVAIDHYCALKTVGFAVRIQSVWRSYR